MPEDMNDQTWASVEDYESRDGRTRKQLVIRFASERDPVTISFTRARLIERHWPDIQAFLRDHAYKKRS